MEYTCPGKVLQSTCTFRNLGAPGWVSEIEMQCLEDSISARRFDFCIPILSMNSPSLDTSKMRLLKNVISISLRPGASILATRPSKYELIPRKLRRERTGRMTRSPDGRGERT